MYLYLWIISFWFNSCRLALCVLITCLGKNKWNIISVLWFWGYLSHSWMFHQSNGMMGHSPLYVYRSLNMCSLLTQSSNFSFSLISPKSTQQKLYTFCFSFIPVAISISNVECWLCLESGFFSCTAHHFYAHLTQPVSPLNLNYSDAQQALIIETFS